MADEQPDIKRALVLAGELEPTPALAPLTPTIISQADPRGELFFSRYQEDGTLRLFRKGSLLDDDPAGYSDREVVVKVLVKRPHESFMVCIPTTRMALDQPDFERQLAEIAWAWRS